MPRILKTLPTGPGIKPASVQKAAIMLIPDEMAFATARVLSALELLLS